MRIGFAAGLLAITLLCAVTHPAAAVDCSGGTDTCRTVVDSIDLLEGGNYSGVQYKKISVSCYHPVSPTNKCAGGGDFDFINAGTSCASSLPDGATVVRDNAPSSSGGPDCFGRKNFGLNGIVDARQCGVFADGVDAHLVNGSMVYDVDLLNSCLTIASGAAYHIVTTGGGVIVDNKDDIRVTDNVTLTCGGSNITAVANNDFRLFVNGSLNLSKAIVLDPTAGGVGYTVRITGRNAHFEGCTEVAGAGPTGTENPYSPSTWFPDCPPTDTVADCATVPGGATTYLRSAELEASAFNPNPTAQYPGGGPASQSVGVSVEAPGAVIRDVTMLGFGRCIAFGTAGGDGEHAPGGVMERVNGDCNTGVTV